MHEGIRPVLPDRSSKSTFDSRTVSPNQCMNLTQVATSRTATLDAAPGAVAEWLRSGLQSR